jgi:hypothetical protein
MAHLWRTLELSGSATVSLRIGSSTGIAELDFNRALAASVIVMLLRANVSLKHAVYVDQGAMTALIDRGRGAGPNAAFPSGCQYALRGPQVSLDLFFDGRLLADLTSGFQSVARIAALACSRHMFTALGKPCQCSVMTGDKTPVPRNFRRCTFLGEPECVECVLP